MKKRISDIIVEYLVSLDIRHMFGITGKSISPLVDSTLNFPDFQFITSKNEAGAAYMAYGYAQSSGKIGVCVATSGGGGTNLTTGVATAFMNSIPMLIFTGQVPTKEFGKGSFQESTGRVRSIDMVDFFKPICKDSFMLIRPENIHRALHHAVKVATSGRMGPVHISLPVDIQMLEIDDNQYKPIQFQFSHAAGLVPDDITQLIALLDQAKKPVLLLGWGAVLSDAGAQAVKLAERLQIPIATSPQGKGIIPTDHPLCLGVMGLCGHAGAIDYLYDEADLIFAIGTSFSEFGSLNWNEKLVSGKKLIQLDIDSTEIGKNFPVDLGIVADAQSILMQINFYLDKMTIAPKVVALHNRQKFTDIEKCFDASTPIKPQKAMYDIWQNSPQDTIFLADSGSHWGWATHYLPIREGGHFFPTLGLGAMGASICSAIGVKLARPEQPVICICGDGSFMMNGNEIVCAENHNIAVIWVIFNDAMFNMPNLGMMGEFGRSVGTVFHEINFAKMAQSLNVTGYRVESSDELARIIPEAIALNKPVVIDVIIDKTEIPPIGRRLRYAA